MDALSDCSTWDLVAGQCPASQLQEIKEALGCDVIDLLTELQAERQALREIADQLADEINSANSVALPEPPEQRERLMKEIRFFIDGLKVRKCEQLIQSDHSEEVEEQLGVLQYVMFETGSPRQGSSELSCKLRSVSRSSSLLHSPQTPDLFRSSISRLSSSLASSPSSSHTSESAHFIREAIMEDINEVQQDITCLNNLLEISIEPKAEIPSLLALRKMSKKLEQKFLTPKPPDIIPTSKRPSSSFSKRVLPPIPTNKAASITKYAI